MRDGQTTDEPDTSARLILTCARTCSLDVITGARTVRCEGAKVIKYHETFVQEWNGPESRPQSNIVGSAVSSFVGYTTRRGKAQLQDNPS